MKTKSTIALLGLVPDIPLMHIISPAVYFAPGVSG